MTSRRDDETQATLPRAGGEKERLVTSFVLEVETGPDRGARFAIDGASPTPLLLGSSRGCNLRVSDNAVSRRHVAFSAEADGLRMTDLDSTNGTFLGPMRVYDVTLAGGEIVTVGGTALRVHRQDDVRTREASARAGFGKLVGQSDAMRRLYPLLERLAQTDAPLIVEGESGTGKELLAESLHDEGARRDGPFVVFDCAAIPPALADSALFGHARGAFPGASSDRAGLFEQASGGTLLVDEIGDLEMPLQAKLLRAIQRSSVQRAGSARAIPVDVRVIASTRRDLERAVAAGRFNDDLFYRLNVARVELPPLRRRRADVPILAHHFWKAMGGEPAALSNVLVARFEEYAWPGNVRELYNAVARQLALGDLATHTATAPHDAPAPSSTGLSGARGDAIDGVLDLGLGLTESRERVVRIFEERYLTLLLARHEGNVTRAAEAAGLARRNLHEILERIRLGVR